MDRSRDQEAEQVADHIAYGDGYGRQYRLLAEQHHPDLSLRKTENAQARKLPPALGQGYSRPVVDHSERDDAVVVVEN